VVHELAALPFRETGVAECPGAVVKLEPIATKLLPTQAQPSTTKALPLTFLVA